MSDSAEGLRRPDLSDGTFCLELPHHGIWIVDEHDRTVAMNAAMRDLLGLGETPAGRPAREFFARDERSAIEERQALRAFGVSDEYETRLLTPDGLELPVLVSASPRFDGEGGYVGTVCVVRDLRVEKTVQAAISERMGYEFVRGHEQQLGRYLTTGLAHALNTSLQAIVGYSDIAQATSEVPEALAQPIAKMHEAAVVCSKLVANLLSLAHLGDESPKTVDLVEVIDEALASREVYLPANNVVVTRDYPEDPVRVWAEPARLRRAISHLVNNACEIALVGGGGSLGVSIGLDVPGAESCIEIRLSGHQFPASLVGLAAADIRPGLDPLTMSHAVAMAIVSDLGGAVEVTNDDEGSAVMVWLPTTLTLPRRQPDSLGAATPVPATDGAVPQILVIDDEPFVLELNREALEEFGDIETADGADTALSLLTDKHFDLIISDLRMPGALDGIGLYRWLSAEHPEMVERIVFTTADTLSPQAQDFLVSSGRPFIKKPYNIRQYQAFVARLLGR
ncbi:MAG: response regulator [Deltaproteobacteria bacterium]|nr:response regulator [Deltaproteobacteria bacterium]MCB9786623.1 response regulator [Deltaproteobacteria bacterium]